MSIDLESYIPFLSIVISTMGVSFVFKDFIGDLLATMVIKKTGDIKVGKRIKIKVPNYMLMSNPVMVYGDTIIDEVVAYVPRPYPDSQSLLDSMKEAIINNGN